MTHIKNLNADIMLLQETYLCNSDNRKLNRPWIDWTFHSQFNVKKKGHSHINLQKCTFHPKKGNDGPKRLLCDCHRDIIWKAGNSSICLCYNWDNQNFVTLLFATIPNLDSYLLIMGGDMNCVIDPTLDRSSPRLTTPMKMSQALSTGQYVCLCLWGNMDLLTPGVYRFLL